MKKLKYLLSLTYDWPVHNWCNQVLQAIKTYLAPNYCGFLIIAMWESTFGETEIYFILHRSVHSRNKMRKWKNGMILLLVQQHFCGNFHDIYTVAAKQGGKCFKMMVPLIYKKGGIIRAQQTWHNIHNSIACNDSMFPSFWWHWGWICLQQW